MKKSQTVCSHARDEAGCRLFSDRNQNGGRERTRFFRVSPNVAVGFTAVAFALCTQIQTDLFHRQNASPLTVGVSEAVDVSLQRLMRSRVSSRLQRDRQMRARTSPEIATVDGELIRLGEHPLYKMIKERLSDHLMSRSYERICLLTTPDSGAPMLSLETEAELNRVLHALKASIPVTDASVARFLNEHEASFGESIVAKRCPDRYDVALTFLLQLLCEFPDKLEPISSAIELTPSLPIEVESDLAEGAVD
jgi:hypothetical protein